MKQHISIETQTLFELIYSNSELGKKEYASNAKYDETHFHYKIETKIIKFLKGRKLLDEYMKWEKLKSIMTRV